MSCKTKEKKWKKYLTSDSDSDKDITFTKIKKIYKCGICDKKIKNYCKCTLQANSNLPGHLGSNIITIMTNPDNDNKQVQVQKGDKGDRGDKGDKGDKGLTGSMGLHGNSFIFFTPVEPIKSGDFIGINRTDNDFNKTSIGIPYEFYIKQIGFAIKNQISGKCTITLYVNNKPTDYVVCICEGSIGFKSFNSIVKIKNQISGKCTITLYVNNKVTDYVVCICEGLAGFKSFNSIIKIKPTDLFCFKINYDTGTLSSGICVTLVIN